MDTHGHPSGEGFWEEYWSILSDPAHLAAELTFTLVDILILTPIVLLLWSFMKAWMNRALQKEHRRLDQEHGVSCEDHHEP